MTDKPKLTTNNKLSKNTTSKPTLNPSPNRKHSASQSAPRSMPALSKSDQKPISRGDDTKLQANISDINSEGKSSGVPSKKGSREVSITAPEAISE